ncbi:MAG: N-acetyl-gamma-glutamyl-phosphate reductase [bacterium]|nr:N-acetyl-gamma-glutamyl-phosphate reductase [bacterium]
MIPCGIAGASGYTGAELLRLLSRHPHIEVARVTADRHAGRALEEVFPFLRGEFDLTLEKLDVRSVAEACRMVFCALPHTTSMEVVPALVEAGCLVVDLSADFRFRDPAVYEAWYGAGHVSPELCSKAVYGLPELHRDAIRGARLVANPGCYPTSVVLAVAPLLRSGLIEADSVIADCKSGTSGAGRREELALSFSELSEDFRPYQVAAHRHTPEMEQELSAIAGRPITCTFTPHLVPMTRGILSTVYATLVGGPTEEELYSAMRESYADEPFVRVLPPGELPATGRLRGTNMCELALKLDERTGRVIVLSALDNLGKGASGLAIQNANIMLDLDETAGLTGPGLFP